jgi:AraC-like DNA-binding protein
VGLRLRPGALPAVIDASAREFVDRSVAIEDVFGTAALADLELGPGAAAPLILHELIRLIRRASGQRTVRHFLPDSTSPAWTVADVARWTGEATRSLRERAHREIGLSPKRTLRVLRLHSALHERRRGRSWAQVAYAAGYADQAHLTRELRSLLGETPSAWQARASAVSFKTANRAVG